VIAVCGHTSRTQRAFDLSREIGAGLVLDDGTVGSNANHDRAWRYAASGGSQWSIVVEDDAVPIAEFGVHAVQMLKSLRGAPGIVSFYMGTSYPIQVQSKYKNALARADEIGAGWIKGNGVYHGVAVAIRTKDVPHMLKYVKNIDKPYDERLSDWARSECFPCWYTNPSLVDHEDSDPVLPASRWQPRDKARRAWRTGAPLNKARYVDM